MSTEGLIQVVHAGDHRGRSASMRNWADAKREFSVAIRIIAIDAIPARRLQTVAEAERLGLLADSGAGSLQEARREGLLDGKPWVYIGFDKPGAIIDALDICTELRLGAVINVFIEFPSWPLMALRAVVAPHDQETCDRVKLFFHRLQSMTTCTGSAAVFGPGSRPENTLIESLVRARFFRAATRAIIKCSLGQDPEVVPVAITFDGETDVPSLIVDARGGVQHSRALATNIVANPPFPILPGTQIAIAQIPPQNELVLNHARLRGIDHGMRVAEPRRIDLTAISDAIRSSDRNVVSAVNPVRMTD